MLCTSLSASSIDIYLPALPELAKFFHSTDNILRISVMISPMVSAVTGLFYGGLSDVYGRRIIFLTCFLVFTIGSVWCGFSDSAVEFLLARFVQALGSTGIGLLAVTILSDYLHSIALARYLGIHSLLYPLAFALAPNIGACIMLHTSWRGMFFFLAIAAGGLWIALARVLPETLQKKENEPPRRMLSLREWACTLWSLLRTRSVFRNMALTNALSVAISHIFITNAPFIFEGHFGLTKMQYTNLLIIPHAVNFLGCILYSVALRRTTPKVCMNFGRAVLFLFLIATVVQLTLWHNLRVGPVIALYALASFGQAFLITTSTGFALASLETDRGLGTGVIQFTRNGLSSFLISACGYLCHGQVNLVFIAMGVCTVTVLLVISASYPRLPEIN